MKTVELLRYSGGVVRRTGLRPWLACLLPIAGGAFFRLAEAALYSLMLYFGILSPRELFTGGSLMQTAVWGAFTVLRWLACGPLVYAAGVRVWQLSRREETAPLGEVLLRRPGRSLLAYALCRGASFLGSLPAAALWFGFFLCLRHGAGERELFLALHCGALGTLAVIWWAALRLKLAAVPLIMAAEPEKGALSCVAGTLRLLKGRGGVLLRTGAVFLLPAVTAIGLPWAAVRFAAAMGVSTDIFRKEDEYAERAEIYRRAGPPGDAERVPARRKGRITAAAGQAQAHRERPDTKRPAGDRRRPYRKRRRDRAPEAGRQLS
ncbi:MAG: hypothetical protein IJ071_12235 [Ruminococcus sp.]|nr:hypothetical protein [Ruminococcus sp.]